MGQSFANDSAPGLTGIADSLVATRPRAAFRTGSIDHDADGLVLDDFAGMLSCDDRLSEYLSGDGDLYYELFSGIIEETIRGKFGDGYGTLYAMVDSSAEDAVVLISVAVEFSRTALLPVFLETVGRELTVSFIMPCSAEFSLSLSIEVDSSVVLGDDAGRGCSISVDHLAIEISSIEEYPARTAEVVYRGSPRTMRIVDPSLEAFCGWYLTGGSGGTSDPPENPEAPDEARDERPFVTRDDDDRERTWLTYERIARGEYEWLARPFGEMRFSLRQIDTGRGEDGNADEDILEVFYETDDVSVDATEGQRDAIPHRVSVVDNGESFDLTLSDPVRR